MGKVWGDGESISRGGERQIRQSERESGSEMIDR